MRLLRPSLLIAFLVFAVAGVVTLNIPLWREAPPVAAVMQSDHQSAPQPAEEALSEPEPDVPDEVFIEEPVETEEVLTENAVELDLDAEFEEVDGEEAFTGPSTNAAIGLGGGAGGGRRGRGGRAAWQYDRVFGVGDGGGKASIRTWKRSTLVPHTSKLQVGDDDELELRKMLVNVRVDGFRARVVLDCFFRNDRDRQLEGTFKLRLPDGASPYFLAFGETVLAARPPARAKTAAWDAFEPEAIVASRAWSAPKLARVVPRIKAAHAYTETARRRIDPALLEWSGAGVFRARVFPLAPGKLHRIVLAYDVNLLAVGEHLEYRLQLPEKVPTLAVDLEIRGADAEVTPKTEARGGRYSYKDPPARTFVVRCKDPGALLLRGADAETGPYFATRFSPALPAAQASGRPRALFLVDVSLSSGPDGFRVWLDMLEAVLRNNRESLREFNVCFFNIERFWWSDTPVANTRANVAKVIAHAKTLALEGATDLAAVLEEVAGEDADLFLLSDGAATWGASRLPEVKGALFAYATGLEGSDTATLQALARRSGGAVFTVAGPTEVAAASTAHTNRPWRIAGLAVEGGSDLLLAGRPLDVFSGQSLFLTGRGRPASDGAAVLTLEQGGVRKEIRVPFTGALESPLAPRAYGQVAVAHLEEHGAALEEQAQAYAVHFRVPGKTCSLLMLESEADYEQFGIEPEKNAFRIRAEPAAALVERAASADAGPRAELRARLDKLTMLRRLRFELSQPLQVLLDRLPERAFDVPAEPLRCKDRARRAPKLDTYDEVADEAKRRRQALGTADALRAWSSLVEENAGDGVVARDVGFSALELGWPGHAYHLFRRVAESRAYEPQTYLALARSLEDAGKPALAVLYHEVVLSARWTGRVGALRTIAGRRYLRLLRGLQSDADLGGYARARLPDVAREFDGKDADLVVTIEWNTDGTDVDLHVIDPKGERCYYSHPETALGGRLTEDVTDGFGPERFTLEKAAPGEYLIGAHYFSGDAGRTATRTRVFVTIERRGEVTRKVITLARDKQMHGIARIRFGTP